MFNRRGLLSMFSALPVAAVGTAIPAAAMARTLHSGPAGAAMIGESLRPLESITLKFNAEEVRVLVARELSRYGISLPEFAPEIHTDENHFEPCS